MEFSGVFKKKQVEFPVVLVLGLNISKGCNTILFSIITPWTYAGNTSKK